MGSYNTAYYSAHLLIYLSVNPGVFSSGILALSFFFAPLPADRVRTTTYMVLKVHKLFFLFFSLEIEPILKVFFLFSTFHTAPQEECACIICVSCFSRLQVFAIFELMA